MILEQDSLLVWEWLQRIGREKIQTYQDSFAQTFGMSLCLLSLKSSKIITIGSDSSLFCYHMMKTNCARCIQERESAMKYVLTGGQICTFRCYRGLNFAISPVVYHGKTICLAYAGGANFETDRIYIGGKLAGRVAIMTRQNFFNMLDLLQNTLNLLDLAVHSEPETVAAQQRRVKAINEHIFLRHKLSRREIDIAQAVCECLGNREIADKLFISEKTVKTHVGNILAKMGMTNRRQLVLFCRERNKE